MLIENILYFALGFLAAGLLALVIMPAVWRRAVRLTKRRIEAATPITMAEFRADKDQLRAEFALTTRKLEMTIETLRKRLAEQVSEADGRQTDMGALKAERDAHLAELDERASREAELHARLQEVERDHTDVMQRLRMRERELAARTAEVQSLREAARGDLPKASTVETGDLTGDYEADLDKLGTALVIERRRATFLEEEVRALLAKLKTGSTTPEAAAAIDKMRDALERKNDPKVAQEEELVAAEARISNAENALNAILAEATSEVGLATGQPDAPLAEKLTAQAETDALRIKVKTVEAEVLAGWAKQATDPEDLRERLGDIAKHVTRLVYAAQSEEAAEKEPEESLFDKVQRFATEIEALGSELPPRPEKPKGRVSDRMSALREIQER